ncbi:phycobiliprotein lyase [Roseofilum sp. BLCC_M154]|uniref:Chromophore lyase CpcS/CpeS n=1 Tax=Roseofilum acuticapitatum BLCC-M154 TaxID=3022444 RepID=A0ABT7ARN7_9CYAN|nr:phycobiliprotein lyase [Roseofilum acuticapitatum]MDJ1169570.1 phycobiliprotein lyase [Roseofilum acuticapitatum BLCC-M154]
MISPANLTPTPLQTSQEQETERFFRETAGRWSSQRRYYTLPDGDPQEISSIIEITYLPQGSEPLRHLARLHQLEDENMLLFGSVVSWHSQESITGKKQSDGETIIGVLGNLLYRDRGFATSKPVTASYFLSNPQTLCLRTEYNRSVFEEEIKLIGQHYRTRQTIISRAGEEQMIGQYLEKRID